MVILFICVLFHIPHTASLRKRVLFITFGIYAPRRYVHEIFGILNNMLYFHIVVDDNMIGKMCGLSVYTI